MQHVGGALQLSASDLIGHLHCRYLTALDLAVANGALARPKVWDPVLEVLAERGALHEKGYVEHLKADGLSVTAVEGFGVDAGAVVQTLEAMKAGVPIIVQGALQAGHWGGRADILRRVELPSYLGPWSYEVIDTKLARETKGSTVLQMCLYTDLLASAQKRMPEFAHVVVPEAGFEPQSYRIAHYGAYYRRVRRSLEQAVTSKAPDALYPDPNPHCDICRWRLHCDGKRRADDHLSLVAGISKSQKSELQRRTINTMAELATMPMPLAWRPERGAVQSDEKVREQARIQVQGRAEQKVIHETLPIVPGFGLASLPCPSLGDIFLDLEGDPFVSEGGLEFLFGYAFRAGDGAECYTGDWSFSRVEEKAAFERFVDFAIGRLEQYPNLQIFHFAPYEPAALKRLMGRYATRENEIDEMLRAGLFVDLYAVIRHGIRASVESYSIKKLEALYAFERAASLADVGKTMAKVQACLELGDLEGIEDQERAVVQAYNRDDCVSTWRLRDWLEDVRAELIKAGAVIERPTPKTGEASPDLTDWQRNIADLVNRLTDGIPVDVLDRSAEQQARWLLAHILDWHRREEKAVWWEYFRLSALTAEDLMDERVALSGLAFIKAVGGTAKAPIHRYSFPAQDTDLRGDEDLRSLGGERFGKVDAISLEFRTVDIKKRKDTADFHAEAVFAHQGIDSKVLAEALVRIGEYVADNGMEGDGPCRAARDLLMLAGPRIGGQALKGGEETMLGAAIRIVPYLGGGVFPIQGPPGAGKTHIGARMICTLAQSEKRIGITANSHKVIRNLLDEAVEAFPELGVSIQCIQKVSEEDIDLPNLQFSTDNAETIEAIGTTCQVAAGTAWLWARPDAFASVDVLFIDEAAQMSLANVLAVSQAADTIVLIGDPRQLEQPTQGTHPEGTGVSALDHILGGHATIPADRGLFLEETWRLHPEICAFTSELFYESRLRPRLGLELQTITSSGRMNGSGLRFMPVIHEGNQSSCPEEADSIRKLVAEILGSGARWTSREGIEAPIGLDDILIIARPRDAADGLKANDPKRKS